MSTIQHFPKHRLGGVQKKRLRRIALIAMLDPTGSRTYSQIKAEVPKAPPRTMTETVNLVSKSMSPTAS